MSRTDATRARRGSRRIACGMGHRCGLDDGAIPVDDAAVADLRRERRGARRPRGRWREGARRHRRGSGRARSAAGAVDVLVRGRGRADVAGQRAGRVAGGAEPRAARRSAAARAAAGGQHPDGVDVSALQHVLGGAPTMPPERGLFLPTTWRLAPSICAFTSELFYEGKLDASDGLERQRLTGTGGFDGAGLWWVPVAHDGNQNWLARGGRRGSRAGRALLAPGAHVGRRARCPAPARGAEPARRRALQRAGQPPRRTARRPRRAASARWTGSRGRRRRW